MQTIVELENGLNIARIFVFKRETLYLMIVRLSNSSYENCKSGYNLEQSNEKLGSVKVFDSKIVF